MGYFVVICNHCRRIQTALTAYKYDSTVVKRYFQCHCLSRAGETKLCTINTNKLEFSENRI